MAIRDDEEEMSMEDILASIRRYVSDENIYDNKQTQPQSTNTKTTEKIVSHNTIVKDNNDNNNHSLDDSIKHQNNKFYNNYSNDLYHSNKAKTNVYNNQLDNTIKNNDDLHTKVIDTLGAIKVKETNPVLNNIAFNEDDFNCDVNLSLLKNNKNIVDNLDNLLLKTNINKNNYDNNLNIVDRNGLQNNNQDKMHHIEEINNFNNNKNDLHSTNNLSNFLISKKVVQDASESINKLKNSIVDAHNKLLRESCMVKNSIKNMDIILSDILISLISEWINQHLSCIVESIVEKEIKELIQNIGKNKIN